VSDKGKTIRKNITYNTARDKEIHEWLESLPPKSHSENIRKAIEFYLKHNEKDYNSNLVKQVKSLEIRVERLEKKVSSDNKTPESDKNKEKDERYNDDYLDAKDILKNLGK